MLRQRRPRRTLNHDAMAAAAVDAEIAATAADAAAAVAEAETSAALVATTACSA